MVKQTPKVIFLMGPTASGKTALSVELAKCINAEIISVDSALVYKGMDIGTAKPNLQERQGIPHHLIDILDPSEVFSTGEFRRQALQLIDEITSRNKVPLLTGGTMLYFNSLLRGLAVLPASDPLIREQLDKEFAVLGKQAMHKKLQAIDPQAAARIHPNDPQRIQRALEVFQISGKTISSYFEQQVNELPFRPIKLVVAPTQRKTLHMMIEKRFQKMLHDGLVDEVKILFQRGDLDVNMPSIRAVGYRQVWAHLQHDYDYQAMQEKGVVATRQLAKRQFTWLRKEKDALWLVTEDDNKLTKAVNWFNDFKGGT